MLGKILRPSGTWISPAATMAGLGAPSIRPPSKRISPEHCGKSPERARLSVVLPAPFEPRMATISPASTVNATPRKTSAPP